MKALDPTLKPRRLPDVLVRNNPDGSVLIMKLDMSRYFFSLDGIGAEVWKMINNKNSLADIEKKMIQKFDPPVARFRKDLQDLLRKLVRDRLISID